MGRLLGLQVRDDCSNLVRVHFHKTFACLDSRNNLYAVFMLRTIYIQSLKKQAVNAENI